MMLLAAAHESIYGPKPKCRDVHVWSAIGKSRHDSDVVKATLLTLAV